MNTIYKSILILGVGLVSLNASAQRQDSTLTRQVLLERDYNPTLNEATKINTAPNIFSPKVQSASGVRFLDQAPRLSLASNKLGQVASGDIRTDVPFTKQRFYLKAGAGTDGNIDGAIGVRAVDTENDKLDLFANYLSASGNVKYAHPTELLGKVKAKYSDLRIGLNYQHDFEPSIFTIGGSYQNMGYNYYGTPFYSTALEYIDLTSKQKVDLISFNTGLKSSEKNNGLLKYEANLSYTNFKSKYGYLPSIDKGPKGGIIEGDVNFYTELGDGNIGVAASVLNQTFSGKDKYSIGENDFDGLTTFTANPYYKVGDINWNINVGANVSYVSDVKNKFVIAPNILAQVHISEVNTLYAGVTGGVNNNTFVDVLKENRYANLMSRVAYSRTPFDINAGFKSGVIPNLEFEFFGGYKQTKGDHLFVASSFSGDASDPVAWSNVGTPVYDNIGTGHFGGLLKTKLIPATILSARVVGYFYNVKNQNKAWGRPSFTVDLGADVKPIDKLTVSMQYILMAGRKGASTMFVADVDGNIIYDSYNMKNISELNFSAEYEIVKFFSVHARVNNVLDQKYEQHLGYTLQGMNVLGGIGLKF